MESIKLQLGSLTILVFITIVYVFRLIHYKRKVNFNFFLIFIVLSFIEIVFDGLTAYSVNNLDKFDHTFNLILHGIFLSSIDAVIFFVFLQVLTMTEMYPTKTINKLLVVAPFILNVILVFSFLPELAFIENNMFVTGGTTRQFSSMKYLNCWGLQITNNLFKQLGVSTICISCQDTLNDGVFNKSTCIIYINSTTSVTRYKYITSKGIF